MSQKRFPLSPLGSMLPDPERESLAGTLRELLLWQRNLRTWPKVSPAPDATPIVSLYAQGALCGCAWMAEGPPGERMLRAFVHALGDGRLAGLGAKARAELRCQLSYARAVRAVAPAQALELLEVGRHGLAVALPGRPVTLLPDVACDDSLDAEGMLQTLERKAETARSAWPEDGLYLFETERVLARQTASPPLERNPITAAAAWLATRVDSKGRVTFGVDPSDQRTAPKITDVPRPRGDSGARAAAQRVGRAAATRARRWLEVELVRALAGHPVEQFPSEPALVAGTLALAVLSGIELSDALMAYAARPEVLAVPWHAAQVVAALGTRAPDALWQACKRHLEAEPWAPWTALAAKARADAETFARATAALVDSVPENGPHIGGVGPNSVPELARTAATVEALLSVDSGAARAARARARGFLLEHQMNGNDCIQAADPELVHGAFPQTPVHDYLQIDVTGHALLALVGSSHSVPPTEFVRTPDSWISG